MPEEEEEEEEVEEEKVESVAAFLSRACIALVRCIAHTPQALDNQQKMPLTHSNIAAN